MHQTWAQISGVYTNTTWQEARGSPSAGAVLPLTTVDRSKRQSSPVSCFRGRLAWQYIRTADCCLPPFEKNQLQPFLPLIFEAFSLNRFFFSSPDWTMHNSNITLITIYAWQLHANLNKQYCRHWGNSQPLYYCIWVVASLWRWATLGPTTQCTNAPGADGNVMWM